MSADAQVELSAVLATDRLETAAEMVERLRLRTDEACLELVLVGLDGHVPEAPAADGFARVQTLAIPGASMGAARAAGVRSAGAPLVALVETHCFPEPGWARALLDRWREGWLTVGPTIDNGNPSPRSWASLVLDYGQFLDIPPGPQRHVPGHNSAYDRALLLDGEIDLETALEDETLLHWELTASGRPPFLDDRARARHVNVTEIRATGWQWFHHSRLFAARRAASWPAAKRAAYVLGAPALAPLFAIRLLRDARRVGRLREVLRAPGLVGVALVARAAGEAIGYLTLEADPEGANPYELHRDRYADRTGSAEVLAPLVAGEGSTAEAG